MSASSKEALELVLKWKQDWDDGDCIPWTIEELLRHENDMDLVKRVQSALDQAGVDEQKACAKICYAHADKERSPTGKFCHVADAAAILARGSKGMQDLDSNILKLGTLEMEAHADRVIVVQDPFVSGYECTLCAGKDVHGGKSRVCCTDCNGTGAVYSSISGVSKKCSTCSGSGKIVCPECEGRGGLIIVSEVSERKPTTGTIASVGPDVVRFKRGEAVLFPSFSGHAMDFDVETKDGVVKVEICILRESEVLARVKGHLEMRRVKKSAAMGTAA